MQQLVTEIKSIPGVIGACCYHSRKGLVANSLPGLFKTDRLNEIGRLLAKILAAGRLNFPDLSDLTLQYEETAIVCRPIDQNTCLAILCDPAINMNLLGMSLNLAMENFQPAVSGSQTAAARTDALLPDEPLPEAAETMRRLLAKVVGPMASIMFDEALTEVRRTGAGGDNLLNGLLSVIVREIGDEEMAARYRELVTAELKGKS
ncbi:hypothetical protein EDC39_101323 [Geothermobacter ehrlichii]|uniref:DUF8082 domain-containing protein n=1 Tax=Geothermobacter ehrlichii TaxID=213224 RepID=A0A5D3WNL7_9BACT|nr:hypothetical protein [Geothermobacter ehrlichii]TYP00162.1 hypothetical protein EDC39_101323 [Geothermobacter ehrlichii]